MLFEMNAYEYTERENIRMKKIVSVILTGFLIFHASFGTVAASVSDNVVDNNMETSIAEDENADVVETVSNTEDIVDSTEYLPEAETTENVNDTVSESEAGISSEEESIVILDEEMSEELNQEEELLQASSQLKITAVDKENGQYRICLGKDGVSGEYTSYRAVVWSSKNGQDDLIWYNMTLKQDGSYVYHLQLLDHFGESGTYNVHVYGFSGDKTEQLIAKTTFDASEMKKNVITVSSGSDQRYFTVQIKNIVADGKRSNEISQVLMPTWSVKDGQDDIVWGNATKVNKYTWEYVVDITKHKSDAGSYSTHIYAKVNDQSILLGKKSFTVAGIDGTKASITVSNAGKNNGIYGITAKGFSSPARISSVRAAVWSDRNGRDDLKWEQMTAHRDGTYTYNVDISAHNYETGTYIVQIYVKDVRGVEQCVKTKKWTVTKMMNTNVIKIDISPNQSALTLKLLNASGDIKDVYFPVWGDENGQNDITWYHASKTDSKTWTVQVPISNHKEAGVYHIHCYNSVDGTNSLIGKAACKITGFYDTAAASAYGNKKGYIKITVSGVNSPAGVTQLRAAVWTENNGRDDIRWYNFEKSGAYWIAIADASYHNGEKGRYFIHIWGTDTRGISQCIKKTSAKVTTIEAMPSASAIMCSDEMSYTLKAKSIIGATSVSFAVWGNENGQNDLKWYNGTRIDGRNWTATADMMNHLETGLYHVHVYAVINGTNRFICSTAFQFTGNPVELRIRRNCENVYNMVGRDLKACFYYVVNSMTYVRINGHLTPPAGWTRCQNYGVMALETLQGNCFFYAAAFYYLAKYLGYNAEYVEGQVPSRRGGYTPHGWVVIDGAYICDPEAQAEIARNLDFYMMPIGRTWFSYVR